MENAIIVCDAMTYRVVKQYIKAYFPNNKIVIWKRDVDATFTEPGYYITIRHLPHFDVTPPSPLIDGSSGFWRYGPFPRPWHYTSDLCFPKFSRSCKVGFINTEHLTDQSNLEYNKRYLSDNIEVYDYSTDNIRIFGRGTYLPYKVTDHERMILSKCLIAKKEYDVCMICIIQNSRRRMAIVNELIRRGVKVDVINNVYDDERDIRVGKSRILLNIHQYDRWNIYESIRCERWRAVGMPIISETSLSSMPSGIIEASYDKIVDTVINTLSKMKSH